MLVLKRYVEEEIWLDLPNGERIVLKPVEVRSGFVRMGITAPASVTIRRAELSGTHDECGRLIQCGGL